MIQVLAIAYSGLVASILGWMILEQIDVNTAFKLLPSGVLPVIYTGVVLLPLLLTIVIWISFDVDTEFNSSLRQAIPILPVLIFAYTYVPTLYDTDMVYILIAIFVLGLILINRIPRDHQQIKFLLMSYLGLPLIDTIILVIQNQNSSINMRRVIIALFAVFAIITILLSAIAHLLKHHYTPISYANRSDELLYQNTSDKK